MSYSITDGADGGSRVEIHRHREPVGLENFLAIAPMRVMGSKMLTMNDRRAFDRYEELEDT